MSTSTSHVWKPSSSRLVTLDAFVPVPRGSSVTLPPPLNWPAKDPGDVLDYQFDIGPAIQGNEADGIAGLEISVAPDDPGDLEITGVSADGARAVLWVSGGQPGTVYTVTFLVTTLSGRTISRSVLLPVMSLSSTVAVENAIQISEGIMLTDQSGNPILAT